MMTSARRGSWNIGTIAGIPFVLSWTWLVFAVFITLVFSPLFARLIPDLSIPGSYGAGFSFALLLFASVFLHELAHALVARSYGWHVHSVTINMWGGQTAYDVGSSDTPNTPGRSLLVAVIGPATNALIALVGVGMTYLVMPSPLVALMMLLIIYANWILAVFNILPGHPLDGGRIIESIVWKITGSQNKGQIATGWGGRIIAIGLVIVLVIIPVFLGSSPGILSAVIVLAISVFLWQSAGTTIHQAQRRIKAARVTPERLMRPAVTVSAYHSVKEIRTMLASMADDGTGVAPSVVVVSESMYENTTAHIPLAVVDPTALNSVPEQFADQTSVVAVCIEVDPYAWVPLSASGPQLIAASDRYASFPLSVMNQQGKIVGVVYRADIMRALSPSI